MSLASNSLLKTIYKGQNPNDKQKRLAKLVEYNSNPRSMRVQFYGEEVASQKFYRINANVDLGGSNATFVLEKINGTYIVTGRI